ncbi:SRPBCC domain-containing protein [Pseudoroseicyclus sp. CXY001]|uniref:SRPBCC domain-containing protein n=1 Tax=Pseudoroseicyclus sp. CXY001 TaxID=3242492 RepID=UPI0035717557
MSGLTLERVGDSQVVITRHFKAPPEALFRAHTEAAIVQQWMLGPPGWTMPQCICEPVPGGRIRYDWAHPEQGSFYLTGEFIALERPHRIVHVERMHLPDVTPDNRIETRFEPDGAGTKMVMHMQLPSAEAREAMLATGMDEGMEASYQALEGLLQRA